MSELEELIGKARVRSEAVFAQTLNEVDVWFRATYPELFTPEAERLRQTGYEAAYARSLVYQEHGLESLFGIPLGVYLGASEEQNTALIKAALLLKNATDTAQPLT